MCVLFICLCSVSVSVLFNVSVSDTNKTDSNTEIPLFNDINVFVSILFLFLLVVMEYHSSGYLSRIPGQQQVVLLRSLKIPGPQNQNQNQKIQDGLPLKLTTALVHGRHRRLLPGQRRKQTPGVGHGYPPGVCQKAAGQMAVGRAHKKHQNRSELKRS